MTIPTAAKVPDVTSYTQQQDCQYVVYTLSITATTFLIKQVLQITVALQRFYTFTPAARENMSEIVIFDILSCLADSRKTEFSNA